MSSSDVDSILDEFNKDTKTTLPQNQALYYTNAFFVAIVPVYLYVTIFNLGLRDYFAVYVLLSGGAGVVLALSYAKVAESVFPRLLSKVSEISGGGPSVSSPKSKSTTKNDKKKFKSEINDQRHTIIGNEATAFAMLYNNLFYLFFVVVMAFFVFKSLPSLYNYILSVGVSSALVFFSSTSKTG
eukprot:TRINITY_DN12845_c0_g1_i1.p1 TRINITY_DN12845_c0_g1~~TRINITY_DN12845_c0_g1_i1.p1  ORF type:complete len:184 (-),score=36.73 TRINITY_DN12845_c0_g1_i1:102-653(-)